MNEKKLNLLEKGLSLFAEKGYHSTSIQEIASEAGISKGAFYLYFQSKEDFVASSIEYIYIKIKRQMEQISLENLPVRQIFLRQIVELMNYLDNYKGFIMMYVTESITIGDRMDSLIKKMKLENYHWMENTIEAMYGNKVKKFLIDAIIQFDGLLNGYFKWIMMYDIKVDHTKTSEFIVNRLDDVVTGMLKENEPPLITKAHLTNLKHYKKEDVAGVLDLMFEKVRSLPVKEEKRNQLFEVLDTLKQKKAKSDAQPILLQGLLAHFSPYPVLHDECERLAELWEIELL